jgi:hypothetical protein
VLGVGTKSVFSVQAVDKKVAQAKLKLKDELKEKMG